MKKIIIMFLLSILVISCSNQPQNNPEPDDLPYDYSVIRIDDCEYLKVMGAYQSYTLTHKGNCKNSIHPEHLRN